MRTLTILLQTESPEVKKGTSITSDYAAGEGRRAAAAGETDKQQEMDKRQPPQLPPQGTGPFPPPMRGRRQVPRRLHPSPPPLLHRLEPVDREKTCPLLLRVFTKIGSHHNVEEFSVRGKQPKDEVQIYTWKDATLRELTELIKEVAPQARQRNARLSFAVVYPHKRTAHIMLKEVGMTLSYGRRPDDIKALGELNFQIGDFLDVAIL